MAYAAKVSGLMVYVQDEEQYKPIINKVAASGIPLVTIDSDAEGSNRIAYVGTDNAAAGSEAAKELINQIGTEGKVAVIMGGRNAKNQVERVSAFTEYIKSNSQIEVSDIESSDAYLLQAELAAEKILSNNKDVRALFCASAQDGIGAAKAVSKLSLSGKVKIIAFDDLPETLAFIENGTINATIVQRPYLMGYRAVNIIMDRIEGKDTKGIFLTDILVVKKENLEHFERGQGGHAYEK
jgi:ribose transport system substrate-binding protein